jgi:hypothetical protein
MMALRSTGASQARSFAMLAPVALPTGLASGNLNDSQLNANGTTVAFMAAHGISDRQLYADARLRR